MYFFKGTFGGHVRHVKTPWCLGLLDSACDEDALLNSWQAGICDRWAFPGGYLGPLRGEDFILQCFFLLGLSMSDILMLVGRSVFIWFFIVFFWGLSANFGGDVYVVVFFCVIEGRCWYQTALTFIWSAFQVEVSQRFASDSLQET